MMNEGLREQARESKREISFACDAIIYEQYVILYYNVGPTCRGPNSCIRTPLRYKREALAVHRTRARQTQALVTFSLSWEGNTTHSGRRVLRSGGPNHSKSLVFIVFLSEIDLRPATPRVYTLRARAGAFRHPAVVSSTTTACGLWSTDRHQDVYVYRTIARINTRHQRTQDCLAYLASHRTTPASLRVYNEHLSTERRTRNLKIGKTIWDVI